MFKFIGDFIGGLWRTAQFWRVSPIGQARVGSPLAGGLLFLVLLFFFIGLVLTVLGAVFGFTLADVDRVIDGAAPTLDFIGKILIQKVLMAIILLICVGSAVALVFFRKGEEMPGWGKTILLLLVCLMFGYCSAVNMIAPLDPY
ncbi:MAG: hypothetical protein AB7G40_10290 [Hyphomonadaceae bacterium]